MRIAGFFSGVVLAGGASSRMGTDKAFVAHPGSGEPLASVARRALADAGAAELLSVGGDLAELEALGFTALADDDPGSGPLGGLLTALGRARLPITVVLACDLAGIDAPTVRRLYHALDDAGGAAGEPGSDAAVPVVGGVRQVLAAAYRTGCRPHLAAAFARGERSVHRAIDGLRVVEVDGIEPSVLVDLDSADDVARYARGIPHHPPEPER